MRNAAAAALVAAVRLVTGIRARWVAPPTDGPCLYFANHTSHLDTLVLWASLPGPLRRTTRPVAAKDYWARTALRRFVARDVFRAVLVDRVRPEDPLGVVDEIAAALAPGVSLIFFPEGTRGDGETVGRFKSGLYYLAKARPDVPLVPVYLQNLARILPKGEALPVPLAGSATFGPPLRLEPDEPKPAFLARAHAALVALTPP